MAIKIDDLPQVNAVTSDSLLMLVNDPNGIANTVIIPTSDYFANVGVVVKFSNTVTANSLTADFLYVANNSTPLSSTPTVTRGRIWYDANYLYIAVANNVVKRVTLTSF